MPKVSAARGFSFTTFSNGITEFRDRESPKCVKIQSGAGLDAKRKYDYAWLIGLPDRQVVLIGLGHDDPKPSPRGQQTLNADRTAADAKVMYDS